MSSDANNIRKYLTILNEAENKGRARGGIIRGTLSTRNYIDSALSRLDRLVQRGEPSLAALQRDAERNAIKYNEKEQQSLAKWRATMAAKAAANPHYTFGVFKIPFTAIAKYEQKPDVQIPLMAINNMHSQLHPGAIEILKSNPAYQDVVTRIMQNAIEQKNTGASQTSSKELVQQYKQELKNANKAFLTKIHGRDIF